MNADTRRRLWCMLATLALCLAAAPDVAAQTLVSNDDAQVGGVSGEASHGATRRRTRDVVAHGTGQTGGLPAKGSVATPGGKAPTMPSPGAPGGPPSDDDAQGASADRAAPSVHVFTITPVRLADGWLVVARVTDATGRPITARPVAFPLPGVDLPPAVPDARGLVFWFVPTTGY